MEELWLVKISITLIILNFLSILIRRFFKLKKSNVLCCGIFGCSIKTGANKKIVLEKLKILGLYNIIRGRDASGIFLNGEIFKSTDEFDDFIVKNILPSEIENNVILGHTRQGSPQYKKTIDEAHPFCINENLIFTHNGTIKNVGDLCKKYSLEEKDFNVDSKLLGTLLYTEGTDVLTHYKGAAALAYTYLEEKDVLYLYHGLSKDYEHGQPLEERPLYCMETEYGIFYSSIENSLKAIKDNDDEKPFNLAYNTIFKIKNGEFLFDFSTKIDRIETNITYYIPSVNNYNAYNRSNYGHSAHVARPNLESLDMKLILKESLPKKLTDTIKDNFKISGDDFIYFHMGRYWTTPRTLVEGPIYLKKGGRVGCVADNISDLCFFFRGVLLIDKDAYKDILDMRAKIGYKNWALNPTDYNFALEISKYSHHPVTNLPEEFSYAVDENYRYKWYAKYEKSTNSFTPKYSGRSYTIKNGYLLNIQSSQREKCILLSETAVKNEVFDLLNKRVPGGNSNLILPFRTAEIDSTKQIIEAKKKENFWFFETIYKDLNEIDQNWTTDEYEAIRRFIRFAYIRDFSLVPLNKEIVDYMDQIIKAFVNEKISLGDYLDKEVRGDSKELFKFYEQILNEKENEKDRLASLSTSESDFISNTQTTIDSTLNSNKLNAVEKEDEKEDSLELELERNEKVEHCIISLEDIQQEAFELVNDLESDYAQEVAGVLITGVDNFLSNLTQPLDKFKKESLKKRVKKIRETKNVNNGTL